MAGRRIVAVGGSDAGISAALRATAVTSALVALPAEQGAALADGARRGTSEDLSTEV